MPNLRGKTWTTSTPANVEDAQFWEDHLISDAVAAKAASSVQSVNNTTPDAQGNVDIVALPDGGTVGQVLTKQSSVDGDADWEDPASSGHTIEDEDGNTMPYQSTLQFENAEVTNDSVNNKTIVDCKGSKGDAATITVGTVTTLPAGSQATVVNSGTSGAAVFDFGIPKGADGAGAVDSVNGYTGVVVLDASDVGALPDSTTIPTKTSELDNDSGFVTANDVPTSLSELSDDATHRLVTDAEKATWDAKVSEPLLKSTVGWTGKNDLPELANLTTESDVTFTKNSDKSVSTSGTATARIQKEYASHANTGGLEKFIGKEVILNGCPSGGSNTTYRLNAWFYDGTNQLNYNDVGSGVKFTFPDIINTYTQWNIKLDINAGGTTVDVSGKTFKGMLRDASITDSTFEPFHKSVSDVITDVYGVMGENGAKNKLSFGTVAGDDSLTAVDNGVSGITVSGAKTSGHWSDVKITMKNPVTLKAGLLYKMVYSGIIPADVWGIRLRSGTTDVAYLGKGETEKTFSVNSDTIIDAWWISYATASAVSDINFTYFPMLIDARDTNPDYVPYAMTNRELTEEKLSISELKTIASSAADFAAFKTAIANL